MKFYVASKWEDRTAVRELHKTLIELGHKITVDWTWHEKEDPGYPSEYAVEDVLGVKMADVYVGLFIDSHYYKGALVEMGVALGLGIPVCIIGHAIDSCLFTSHPLVSSYESVEEFIEGIK